VAPDHPPQGREERIAARKAQILDAAAAIFAEKGFHRATTREIAQAAGVSEGTIYNYFDSKDDLLIGIMSRVFELDQLDGELTIALQADARDFFVTMITDRMDRIRAAQEMLQAILPEIIVNPTLRGRFHQQYVIPIADSLEDYVAARIEMDDLRPVDPRLTVRVLQATFVGLLVLRIIGDDTLQSNWGNLPETLATLLFDGLSPDRG
jgi:AcrR family transcriptional regulator